MLSSLVTVSDGPCPEGCPEPSENSAGVVFSITVIHGDPDMSSQLWCLSQILLPGDQIHIFQLP